MSKQLKNVICNQLTKILEQAIKRAQGIVRKYVSQERKLSDELIIERRQENLCE